MQRQNGNISVNAPILRRRKVFRLKDCVWLGQGTSFVSLLGHYLGSSGIERCPQGPLGFTGREYDPSVS